MGTASKDLPVDYPNIAKSVSDKVLELRANANGTNVFGVLCCGSGIGISIAANKVDGIRCALVHDSYTAKMARKHNDANVIAFGGRVTGSEVTKDALR